MKTKCHSAKPSSSHGTRAAATDFRRGRMQPPSALGIGDGFDGEASSARPRQLHSNRRDPRTGLPFGVKHALEQRSGYAMDDVRVSYNAMLPGTVGANAVTKGARIAVAPGQEQQVAHEAWHVAQQKMRRVRADSTRSGFAISTDRALEAEADAFRDELTGRAAPVASFDPASLRSVPAPALAPLQLDSDDEYEGDDEADDESAGNRKLRKRQKALDKDENVKDSASVPRKPRPKPGAPNLDATPVPTRAKRTKRRNEVLFAESAASAPARLASSGGPRSPSSVAPRRTGRVRPTVAADPPSGLSAAGIPLVVSGTAVASAAKPDPPRRRTPRRGTPPTPKSVPSAVSAAMDASTPSTPPMASANAMAAAAPHEFKTRAKKAPKGVPMPSAPSSAAGDASLGAAMLSAMAPSRPAVTTKLRKKPPVRSKREVPEESDDDAESSDEDSDSGSLVAKMGIFGASQQGLIPKKMGKYYAPPEPLVGRRAEQVARHYANLSLNNVAATQKRAGGAKPVEAQLSAVGKRLLINTNNRAASEAVAAGIGSAGSLHNYAMQADARTPAMDADRFKPLRHQSKITKAQADQRPWQAADARGENLADTARATSILGAAAAAGPVGIFDPDDEEGMAAELAKWKDDTAPRVYVVLHSRRGNKDEHAERVQTRFREAHLKAFETDELSTDPVGPKTTCLGCSAYHEDIAPHRRPHARYSGAYFKKGSPIEGRRQVDAANRLIDSRPATGSISQQGIFSNSNHPDSDTDDEGRPAYPRPGAMSAAFGGATPAKIQWTDRDGATLAAPKAVKAEPMKSRFVRAQKKSRPKTRPTKIAAPETPAAPLPTASLSAAASAAQTVGSGLTISRAVKTPPLARRTPPRAADRPDPPPSHAIPVPLPPVPRGDPPSRPASASVSLRSAAKPSAPPSHVSRTPELVKPPAPAPKPSAAVVKPPTSVKPPPAPSAVSAAAAAPSLLSPLRPPMVHTVDGHPRGRIGFTKARKKPTQSIWDDA